MLCSGFSFLKRIIMESIAKLMVISGNKQMNKFMQCADVFENGKVLGTIKIITANYKENEKVSLKRAGIIINSIKEALEKDEIVSFVHVLEVTNGSVTTENKGEVLPYINKGVRCISDGKKWFVLAKFIEQKTELKVLTNQHMFITGVGFKDGIGQVKFKIKK